MRDMRQGRPVTIPPPEDAYCGNCFWREDSPPRTRAACTVNPPVPVDTTGPQRRPQVREADPPCRHWTPRRADT